MARKNKPETAQAEDLGVDAPASTPSESAVDLQGIANEVFASMSHVKVVYINEKTGDWYIHPKAGTVSIEKNS